MNKLFKYELNKQQFNDNLQTKFVLDAVGKNKKVCEFGCNTGLLSELLKQNHCNVIGLDINKQAIIKAMPFLTESFITDINKINEWSTMFGSRKFDVLLFIHIIEHLINPYKVLLEAKNFLNNNGIIIIGLPNVSNAKDRFDIFRGKFEYTEIGVMDRTHLHFFNQKTAREIIENADLEILEYYSPWQVNPIRVFFDNLPFFWRLAKLFPTDKPPRFPKFSPNLTDVVMLFKCKVK